MKPARLALRCMQATLLPPPLPPWPIYGDGEA